MTNQLQEKDLREMAERMARMETKMDLFIIRAEDVEKIKDDLDRVKDLAVRAENKADIANSRAERADKWILTLGGTTITTIIVAVLNLIMNGG